MTMTKQERYKRLRALNNAARRKYYYKHHELELQRARDYHKRKMELQRAAKEELAAA